MSEELAAYAVAYSGGDLRAAQAQVYRAAADLFSSSQREYDRVAQQHAEALLQAVEAKAALRQAREEAQAREAAIRLGPEADGRNAEERAARLRLALANDSAYQHLLRQVWAAEDNLGRAEADVAYLENRLRSLRRQIEFAIATIRFIGKED